MESLTKEELLDRLKNRFEKHTERHEDITWEQVEERLNNDDGGLIILSKMETTGGEPDVVKIDETGRITFFDCFKECPAERKSLCYDQAALEARKKHKPEGSAKQMADEMGTQLLDEDEYFYLQSLGDFDLKTSTWLLTPDDIRSKKGAIFGDKRYGRTFIYHNGADSYYGSRSFRTKVTI